MGLVSYSESESSGSESGAPPIQAPQSVVSKRPFRKVVDRSKPGKIVVSLPPAAPASTKDAPSEQPPAKRARSWGGGAFSGFNSLLPAPKNATTAPPHSTASHPRPGVKFKTSAAPGFSRGEDHGDDEADSELPSDGLSLPRLKRQAEPSIPEGQKPAEDVKLVGKPLMFKPLSVARKSVNKKFKTALMAPFSHAAAAGQTTGAAESQPRPAPVPEKPSLFSLHTEEIPESPTLTNPGGAYEPLFETALATNDSHHEYAQYAQQDLAPTTAPEADSLDSITADLNLSAASRRELFGRGGGNQAANKVINFNMDQEYRHNETIRAAGDQKIYNPVRAIQGGKNSLKQLVQNAHNQREALEDTFAKGKSNRKEASSRYGWS